ncbi:MAG: hypothetical protein GOV01_00760 [Candidatus Altiarchaeota archaeon]|nr:hypothetical protein [Candidatus Altiarchaeota archaeon]
MEIKLVLINLKDGLNQFEYPFLLNLSPLDIELLGEITPLISKYFGRPWIYVGAEKPYLPKKEFLGEIDQLAFTDRQKTRLKVLIVEREFPAEILAVLNEGDKGEFHDHVFEVSSKLQLEQYLVPDGKTIDFEAIINKKTHLLKIEGPSVLIVGGASHRREGGVCFVTKYPSGSFKQIVE